MKDDFGREELLSDVVEEVVLPSFRADLLTQMLGEVREGRMRRRRYQRLMSAVCILIIVGLAARFFPGHKSPTSVRIDPLMVHSEPLDPGMKLITQPGIVATVNSSPSFVVLVEAMPVGSLFDSIGNDKLLALLAGRPVALVQHGTFGEELVFLNPEDARGFQVH